MTGTSVEMMGLLGKRERWLKLELALEKKMEVMCRDIILVTLD